MSFHGVIADAQTPATIPASSFGDASAFYDTATGDVILSVGENLFFVVLGDGPFFGFTPLGEFDPTLVDDSTGLGAPVTNSDSEIGWSAPVGDVLPSGIFNVGPLLPAGLSFAEFNETFGEARFAFAQRTAGPVIEPLVFFIPEPSSFCFLAVIAPIAVLRRNRR